MLLSLRYGFLFVHIAKTGGTSVRAALKPLRWRDPLSCPMWISSRLSHLCGHRIAAKLPRHARLIAAQEMLPHETFEGLYKFAFVRNPWDLQVSSWHHLQRERPQLVSHLKDFDAFVRWKLDPARAYQYHIDTSIQVQRDHVADLKGDIRADFVGRYETLEQDFANICAHLKLPTVRLPHARRAADRSADYRHYYSDALAERVANHYARDVEAFGYTF